MSHGDSTFGCLLRSFSRSQEVIERATVYRARVGLKRAFRSENDAAAYERGWGNPDMPLYEGPEMQGWRDRKADGHSAKRLSDAPAGLGVGRHINSERK